MTSQQQLTGETNGTWIPAVKDVPTTTADPMLLAPAQHHGENK